MSSIAPGSPARMASRSSVSSPMGESWIWNVSPPTNTPFSLKSMHSQRPIAGKSIGYGCYWKSRAPHSHLSRPGKLSHRGAAARENRCDRRGGCALGPCATPPRPLRDGQSVRLCPRVLHRLQVRQVNGAQGLFQLRNINALPCYLNTETLGDERTHLAVAAFAVILFVYCTAIDDHVPLETSVSLTL